MNEAEHIVRSSAFWRGLRNLRPLSGGFSNAAFVVEDTQGRFVARVGKDYPFHQVLRAREAEAHRAAFAVGIAPELLYARDGVMIMRHLEALTFEEEDVRANWQRCLAVVQRAHRGMKTHIRGQAAIFWVFQILRDYAETLQKANHREAANLAQWMSIVDDLEEVQVPLPIVFGHHDLLPTNFLDDGTRLWLIDWEYGAFGTAMFDLANIAAANSFDAKMESEMLHTYFDRAPNLATQRAYHAMKTAAALREAMWGMVSELHLHAPGVDYPAYAEEHLNRFTRIHEAYRLNFA
jgi:thiamine kinase-like enzyme